jgi:hypothetical protein
MYFTYAEYQTFGGSLAEDAFAVAEPKAERRLDAWTLNRLRQPEVWAELDELGESGDVKAALTALVDRVHGIEDAAKAQAGGSVVTSFSNGVNSFGFANGGGNAAEDEAYQTVCQMLPVTVLSVCATYNRAC